MPRRRVDLMISLAAVLPMIVLAAAAVAADVDYFTDNGFDNSVSNLQHPCAEHADGKTFVAYQGPHEDPYVCAYDHKTARWTGPFKAGVSALGDDPQPTDRKEVDNHGRPALLVDHAGYVHVVFGGHGGSPLLGHNDFGTPGSGRQMHAVTKRPGDISEWEILDNIPPFGTYSQFVKMDDGDIYLFYRHGSHCSDWVYQKSSDNCRTFSPPVSVLKFKPQRDDPNVRDSWYAWFNRGKGDTIVCMYIYHPCLAVDHNKQRLNVYHMKMNCGDGTWQNAAGRELPVPVTKEAADDLTLVHNSGTTKVNHGVCHVDETGAPHIFFRHSAGSVRYTRWLGNAWQEPTAVSMKPGSQDGDMVVESPTSIRLLLEGPRDGGGGEVSWWKSADGGLTWAKDAVVISAANKGYHVSAFVHAASPEAQIIVEEHDPSSTDLYRRLLLWGDKGFIRRPEAEARAAHPLPHNADLRFKTPLGPQGTVAFRLRTTEAYRTGPLAQHVACELLELPGVATCDFEQSSTVCSLRWRWDKSLAADGLEVELPALPGPDEYFVQFTWDAPAGRFTGYVNGTPLRVPGTALPPWTPAEAKEARLGAGPIAVSLVSTEPRYLEPAEALERVPAALRGRHAQLFGVVENPPAPLDVDDRLGSVVYESSLADAAATPNWRMEGPGVVAFEDGWMVMSSQRPTGPEGHLVHWCPAEVPERFVADWEIQLRSPQGLCIVFFAAAGPHGEDIFSPGLPKRTGAFTQYTRGAIDCYHISYVANTPNQPGRITSNMRRNAGFHLVANGPPGVAPGSQNVHAVRLIKDGGHVQLLVDGRVVIDFKDDGRQYGPVLGGGRIGFRQMQWTTAGYRGLRIRSLVAPALDDAHRDGAASAERLSGAVR